MPRSSTDKDDRNLNLKVMIADDHPVVILGAKAVLAADPGRGFDVVGTATSVSKLIDQLAGTPCDVLITDFSMPSIELPDGLSMLGVLRRRFPDVQIVLLSMLSSAHTLRAAMRQGVLGLYNKSETLHELPRATRLAGNRRRYISPSYQRLLEQPNEPLSPKELEVLRMLAGGMSGRDIAILTNRSEKTISRQKRNAMDKLGIVHDGALLDFINGLDATG
jgi:two-component system capsular synthesis response regulator RcsB